MASVVRTTVRVSVASIPAGLVAVGVVALSEWAGPGRLVALGALLVGGLLFVVLYVLTARRMRVREIDSVLEPLLRRLRGGPKQSAPSA